MTERVDKRTSDLIEALGLAIGSTIPSITIATDVLDQSATYFKSKGASHPGVSLDGVYHDHTGVTERTDKQLPHGGRAAVKKF